jgi:hypothetical protein
VDEGTKAKGRSGREEEGQVLQHHSVGHPNEAGVEGEGEDQPPCTQGLRW